jgi:hypothetical protein
LIVDAFIRLRRFERSRCGRTLRVIVNLAHGPAANLSPGILAAPASTREQRNSAVARATKYFTVLARHDGGKIDLLSDP